MLSEIHCEICTIFHLQLIFHFKAQETSSAIMLFEMKLFFIHFIYRFCYSLFFALISATKSNFPVHLQLIMSQGAAEDKCQWNVWNTPANMRAHLINHICQRTFPAHCHSHLVVVGGKHQRHLPSLQSPHSLIKHGLTHSKLSIMHSIASSSLFCLLFGWLAKRRELAANVALINTKHRNPIRSGQMNSIDNASTPCGQI